MSRLLQHELLFTAAGDNNAYAWKLDSGNSVPVATFAGSCLLGLLCFFFLALIPAPTAGHEDYLHSVSPAPAIHALATASEDGTARLWGALDHSRTVYYSHCLMSAWVL